ncbi:Amidase (plasmid) [Roseomonas mucosa]|uniref:amidase n=1 Tax=Roseomonas mucosa TaxID=207340 RepID=UPI00220D502F|nr:amidase [Roseomonas mucosa]QDJ11574.1 Amidase [Roseomonas mucosa]
MNDDLNAFVPGPQPSIRGAPGGPLAGLRFAAKDLFDVVGFVTGAGNPDWTRTHPQPAARHAAAVAALLDAGADLQGKTHTDELAFSLNGENFHYGTPRNTRAPGRVPGGSSSGSAAAVAAGVVETALGTDTGGSVRIPASYCGLYGIRPTHGVISVEGLVPLAPRFDTVGWFARDAATLARLGWVLLPAAQPSAIARLLVLDDAFAVAGDAVHDALAPALAELTARLPSARETLAPDGLSAWLPHFRMLQGRDVWRSHGAWITAHEPAFGPGIRERFAWAADITDAEVAAAEAGREAVLRRLDDVLAPGIALVLPTAPGIAPLLSTPPAELEQFRNAALTLTCIAGLGGLPQVSIPAGVLDGCPVGLSVIGTHGTDLALLDLVEAWSFPVR